MDTFLSGAEMVRLERYEPARAGPHPALLMAHGSGGEASLLAQPLCAATETASGVGVHASHYV
jgi:hypothetical protein